MMTTQPVFPGPTVDIDTQPFWDNLKKHILSVQRCQKCGAYRFPPRNLCPKCYSVESAWEALSGQGKVYSYVTFERLYHPYWQGKVPYNVSIVELNEGIRLYTNIVDCEPEKVYIGMPVEVVFEDTDKDLSLAKFRPTR